MMRPLDGRRAEPEVDGPSALKTTPFYLAPVAALLLASCHEPAVQLPEPASVSPVAGMAGVSMAAPVPLPPMSAQKLALFPASGNCNLEAIDNIPFVPGPSFLKRDRVVVSGWLFPESISSSDAQARLRFSDLGGKSAWEIKLTHWLSRADVVTSLGGNAWDKPGFSQSVDLEVLPPGTYKMVMIYQDSSTSYLCDSGRELILK
jgi:hypothetical protein